MKNANDHADWKISETGRHEYCAKLKTPKGKASILGNKKFCFEINIELEIIIKDMPTGKTAQIMTKELRDHEQAREWVESLLK